MAKDAEKISSYDKQLTIVKLLESWLAQYSLSEAWRHELPGTSKYFCRCFLRLQQDITNRNIRLQSPTDDSVTEAAFAVDQDVAPEPLDTTINYSSVVCEMISRYTISTDESTFIE
jgi:hypothetical protein